mmetsp:Transcript_6281/g.9749  ORF Transcript_6281/g.9749 Transcript_6281/m.9749 type:complete len:141 (+) Transcript_6281:35-457(+)
MMPKHGMRCIADAGLLRHPTKPGYAVCELCFEVDEGGHRKCTFIIYAGDTSAELKYARRSMELHMRRHDPTWKLPAVQVGRESAVLEISNEDKAFFDSLSSHADNRAARRKNVQESLTMRPKEEDNFFMGITLAKQFFQT